MGRTICLVLLAFTLQGCVSTENAPPNHTVSPEMASLIEARDDKKCQSLGAKPGSDAYINCRLKLQENVRDDQFRQQAWQQQRADQAANQAGRDAAIFAGKPTPLKLPQTIRTQCVSRTQIGGDVVTDCDRTEPVQY